MRALLLKGLAVGAVACGLLAAGGQARDEPPAKPAPSVAKAVLARPEPAVTPTPAPKPVAVANSGILVRTPRRPLLLDPTGGAPREWSDVGPFPARSRDGQWVLGSHPVTAKNAVVAWELLLRSTDTPEPLVRVPLPPELATDPGVESMPPAVRWETTGTALVSRKRGWAAKAPTAIARFDPATRAFRPVPADTPFGHPSPDGSRMAVLVPTTLTDHPPQSHRLATRPTAGGEPEFVTPADRDVTACGGFAPDGRRLLYVDRKPGGKVYPHTDRVCVIDLTTRAVTVLAELTTRLELGEPLTDGAVLNPGQPRPVRIYSSPPGSEHGRMYRSMATDGDEIDGLCWSPDGTRVAYARNRMRWEGNAGNSLRGVVVVCGADGRNGREVFAVDRERVWLADWR